MNKMGNKIQSFQLKWQVYATNLILASVIVIVYGIFQYTREFFVVYSSINMLFSFLQWVCLAFIVSLIVIVVLQYKKAGKYTFYDNGFVNEMTNTSYLYHDIISYKFVPQNNKQAKFLQFKTDTSETVELPALLNAKVFELFQEGHAAIWGPFLVQKINAKQMIPFALFDDVTSFKLRQLSQEHSNQMMLSHEGVVLYDKFYKWEDIRRFEVSFTGMMSIKNQMLKTIWLEPVVSIESYYDFVYLLHYYIAQRKE